MTLSSFFYQRSENAINASTPSKIGKETAVTVDSDDVVASTSPPPKIISPTCKTSPVTALKKDATEKDTIDDHESIILDMDTDQLHTMSNAIGLAEDRNAISNNETENL